MDLLACLNCTPHRYLVAISYTHHLHDPRHMAKADLVRQLLACLAHPSTRDHIFNTLSPQEQTALQRLVAQDGRMPLHEFTRAFGPIRPYRPWRQDGPTHPWRHPISTTEKLLYKGLIYLTPSDPQRRQPRYIILPAEFLDLLSPDDQGSPSPTLPCPSAPFNPLLDLALFLAYLQYAHVRPLHGRWLSPRHLRALGSCLSPPLTRLLARSSPEPPLTGSREKARHQPRHEPRSELQAGRVAFIHFLAESLGLVFQASDLLKPSPTALPWLSQPASTQLQVLWETWLSPPDENRKRWVHYRLPGHHLRDPVGFAQRLARWLATLPPQTRFSLDDLINNPHLALDELIPWWEREQGQPARELLLETLEGPPELVGDGGMPARRRPFTGHLVSHTLRRLASGA